LTPHSCAARPACSAATWAAKGVDFLDPLKPAAPEVAHAIRRPNDVATFGWDPAPEVTDADRANLDAAEALTDRLLIKAYDALDGGAKAALLAGTKAIGVALGI